MVWIRNINKRKQYYEETSVKQPSAFLIDTLKYAKGNLAIDLGCGSGVDTKEITRKGFRVIAVDVNEDVKEYFSPEDLRKIRLVIQPIEDFRFVKSDFIYAKSSLGFLNRKKFLKVTEDIKNSLTPGGIFAARLWGKNDSDNKPGKNMKYTFLTIDELKGIFTDFVFLKTHEHEEDKYSADGRMKHWDFIDIIAQKPF